MPSKSMIIQNFRTFNIASRLKSSKISPHNVKGAFDCGLMLKSLLFMTRLGCYGDRVSYAENGLLSALVLV
jgi:hypothetical protein